MVAGKKQKDIFFNENWESEIAAYDEEYRRRDRKFYKNHVFIKESGSKKLTQEENEVLNLYLDGVSCSEIAKGYSVETEVITALIEVIKAKLSLDD